MTTQLLNVGDVIYASKYASFIEFKIDRVTDKTAFSGHTQFFRYADNGLFKIKGADKRGPYNAKFKDKTIELWASKKEVVSLVDEIAQKLKTKFTPKDFIAENESNAAFLKGLLSQIE